MSILRFFFRIHDNERWSVIYAFLYFFCLMCAYFILRPVRDEMGILAGVDNLQWLFTGTFIAMLFTVPVFGFLTKKLSPKKLIPAIYLFFASNIILFYLAFDENIDQSLYATFFIWLSVFNLFAVSIFWSLSSDVFTTEQAVRLYGPIAAGGSCGAIAGPAITTLLVGLIGVENLLLVSAFFLVMATYMVFKLIPKNQSHHFRTKLKGSIWDGFTSIRKSPLLRQLTVYMLLYTSISTFFYFQQAHIIFEAYDSGVERTTYFAIRDLMVNISTLTIQLFLVEKIIDKFGLTTALIIAPIFSVLGFTLLGFSQSVLVLLFIQVVYRSINHAIQRPAREVLFTSTKRAERYRSKNFIDTTVYRAGDAMSGWFITALTSVINSMQVVAVVVIPAALLWLVSGIRAGDSINQKTIKFNYNDKKSMQSKKSA